MLFVSLQNYILNVKHVTGFLYPHRVLKGISELVMERWSS